MDTWLVLSDHEGLCIEGVYMLHIRMIEYELRPARIDVLFLDCQASLSYTSKLILFTNVVNWKSFIEPHVPLGFVSIGPTCSYPLLRQYPPF